MQPVSRRVFLAAGAMSAATIGLSTASGLAAARPDLGRRYITSYYQFTDEAVRILAKEALPNGPEYLHIFVQSCSRHQAQAARDRPCRAAAAASNMDMLSI